MPTTALNAFGESFSVRARKLPASGDENPRAEFGKTQRHRAAQARAAAGDEHNAVLQQIGLIHGVTSVKAAIMHGGMSKCRNEEKKRQS
jgi:hypothetical protein